MCAFPEGRERIHPLRTSGRLFHGAVSAVIRLTGDEGTVRITVSSGEDLKGKAEIRVIV